MVTVVRSFSALRALADGWNALHAEYGSGNPFLHPAWCLGWVESFGPEQVRVVVARDADGELIGLLPLVPSRSAGRTWMTLGTPLVDYGGPLIRPDSNSAVTLVGWLSACSNEWDTVRLEGLGPKLADDLVSTGTLRGLRARVTSTETCPLIRLTPDERWRNTLPPKRLCRLQANRDRLQKEHHIECREAHAAMDVVAAVRRFESLRLQSWWQRGGFKALPPEARGNQHSRLLTAFASNPSPTTYLSVAEMLSGGRLLASSILFWSNDSLLVALKATDTRLGTSVSPGLGLDMFVIELAESRGISSIGFGRGDESYKFILGAAPETTADITLAQPARAVRYLKRLGRTVGSPVA